MSEKKNGLEIVKVGLILFAITAVAALILVFVNSITAPVISEQEEIKMQTAMKNVLPTADSFEEIDTDLSEFPLITKLYKGGDSGYVAMAAPKGYGGAISIAVGVDNDLKVTGISIISQSETAGLGAKCVDETWQSQYIGKTEDITVVKSGAKDNQIDVISSATITSKAVTKGVNEAISAVKALGGGNDE